jgi:hypothetical protein
MAPTGRSKASGQTTLTIATQDIPTAPARMDAWTGDKIYKRRIPIRDTAFFSFKLVRASMWSENANFVKEMEAGAHPKN